MQKAFQEDHTVLESSVQGVADFGPAVNRHPDFPRNIFLQSSLPKKASIEKRFVRIFWWFMLLCINSILLVDFFLVRLRYLVSGRRARRAEVCYVVHCIKMFCQALLMYFWAHMFLLKTF